MPNLAERVEAIQSFISLADRLGGVDAACDVSSLPHLCACISFSKCLSRTVCSTGHLTSIQHQIFFVKCLFSVISTLIFHEVNMKSYTVTNTHIQLVTYYILYLHDEAKLDNSSKGFYVTPECWM